MALVRDRMDECVDLASVVEVTARARAIAEGAVGGGEGEYHSLNWVPVAELSAFVERHWEELIPTSRALCQLFVSRENQEGADQAQLPRPRCSSSRP